MKTGQVVFLNMLLMSNGVSGSLSYGSIYGLQRTVGCFKCCVRGSNSLNVSISETLPYVGMG